ncbi:MMPL family transporter [Mycobacterium intracellulare]|uniref:MMPL family transporter n=1 Tax=Mycobacterium intracellulare TaxID=1767 RepID=UPI001EEDD779|nr:efflux RND transporter permease subunit [Mycobacterium intracellulare]MEE3755353.1 efflux RND transporter permease subunit [Mycobacterium intracellulare]
MSTVLSGQNSWLYRWGAGVARRWRLVLVAGLLAAVLGGIAYQDLRAHLTGLDWEADRSESSQVGAFIEKHFPARGAEQDLVVFDAVDADITGFGAAITPMLSAVRAADGVTGVVGPFDPGATGQVSANRRVAFAVVGLAGDPASRAIRAQHIQQIVSQNAAPNVRAWLTGLSPIFNDNLVVEESSAERGETIGVALALVVLVLTLGSIVASCIPLLVTAASLANTFAALEVATAVFSFDSFVISCVTMIGTGIAIDYSLFVVSRFREELARQSDSGATGEHATAAAIATTIATTGRTILIAGAVVAVSLCSLFVIEAPIYREIAIAIAAAVACTLGCAMTILPALLAALGPRVNRLSLPARWQPAELRATEEGTSGGWARWARWVMRHPLPLGTAATLILLAAAWPLSGLRYGLDLGMPALQGTPSGKAATVLFDAFTPGMLSPIQITASGPGGRPLSAAQSDQLGALSDSLAREPHIAKVDVFDDAGYRLITALPTTPADAPATTHIVEHIRAQAVAMTRSTGAPDIHVGGPTAKFIDLSHVTRAGTPLVLILVLGSSFLFLLAMFRSLALALKAVVMNLLTTAASVGLTVAIFQWGWLASAFGFTSVGFLQVYMPVTIFAVIFGLSMDYQVFLVRRIREEWLHTGDNTVAVVAGIAHTARPITAAATIMVCVFGSFITSDVLEMKQLGFGLAAAIAIDAALVRLLLVPALMRLLGRWNWWLPTLRRQRSPISAAA